MMDNMRTYKSETKKQQQQNAHLLLKNSIMRKKINKFVCLIFIKYTRLKVSKFNGNNNSIFFIILESS